MNKYIRILLVENNELIRYGLRLMLEREEGVEVVADCASVEEAFPTVVRLRPDIVLIDTQMPGMDKMDATPDYKETEAGL